jgi:hypothetical protein
MRAPARPDPLPAFFLLFSSSIIISYHVFQVSKGRMSGNENSGISGNSPLS